MTDDHDAVTARAIADFLDHLAQLRLGGHDDPDGHAAFLTHKANCSPGSPTSTPTPTPASPNRPGSRPTTPAPPRDAAPPVCPNRGWGQVTGEHPTGRPTPVGPHHLGSFNEAYRAWFDDSPPARTTIFVGLPSGLLVEVTALAVCSDQ